MNDSLLSQNSFSGLAFSAVIAILTLSVLLKKERARYFPAVFAFVCHVLFSIFWTLRFGIGDDDARMYHQIATEVAGQMTGTWAGLTSQPEMLSYKQLYPEFLGLLYAIGGPHLLVALVMNAAFCALTVLNVELITKRIGGSATIVGWMGFLLPSTYVFSATPLREAAFWFVSTLIVLVVLKLSTKLRLRDVILFALLASVILTLRGNAGALVSIGAVIALLMQRRSWDERSGRSSVLSLAPAAAVVVGLIIVLLSPATSALLNRYSFEYLSGNRQYLSTAARTGYEVVEFDSPIAVLTGLPVSIARVLAAPFEGGLAVTGIPGIVFGIEWLAVFLVVILGARRSGLRNRRLYIILFPAALLVLAIGIAAGNYGILFRLRVGVIMLILPIAGLAAKKFIRYDIGDSVVDRPMQTGAPRSLEGGGRIL